MDLGQTTRTFDLGYEQMLTFLGRPGTRVRVLYGSMWLTEEGREQDIFAACGDEVTLKVGGLSVIEGLGAARIQLIEPRRPRLARWFTGSIARTLRRLRSSVRAREALARSVIVMLAVAVSLGLLRVAAPGPLSFQGHSVEPAVVHDQHTGAAGVLHGVASIGVGFLAVN